MLTKIFTEEFAQRLNTHSHNNALKHYIGTYLVAIGTEINPGIREKFSIGAAACRNRIGERHS